MTHEELLLFGEHIRNARNSASLTQEQISNKIGISLRFYQMIERGEKSISLDTLKKLSAALVVHPIRNKSLLEGLIVVARRQRQDAPTF